MKEILVIFFFYFYTFPLILFLLYFFLYRFLPPKIRTLYAFSLLFLFLLHIIKFFVNVLSTPYYKTFMCSDVAVTGSEQRLDEMAARGRCLVLVLLVAAVSAARLSASASRQDALFLGQVRGKGGHVVFPPSRSHP